MVHFGGLHSARITLGMRRIGLMAFGSMVFVAPVPVLALRPKLGRFVKVAVVCRQHARR